MRRERIAAPLITLLLLVSVVGGAFAPAGVSGPVGTVEAQAADDPECSTWDALIYDMVSIGSVSASNESTNPCSAAYQTQQLSDEWNASDAAETRTQIHSQAGQLAAGNENFLTVAQNGLTNSETIAFSRGEAAAVETLADGGNVSEAQAASNGTIGDHFAVKQSNLIDRWELNVETIVTLSSRAHNTTGVSGEFVDVSYVSNASQPTDSGTSLVPETGSKTVNLANGSSTQATSLVINRGADHNLIFSDLQYDELHNRGYHYTVEDSDGLGHVGDTVLVRPTESLSTQIALDSSEFNQSYEGIQDRSQSTKKEVAAYIEDSLGPAVQNGELDAENYVSAATLGQEYGQTYNGSDGYIRAIAQAASMGMSTPDIDSTASMTVSHDNATYEGMLLSQNGPENDTWSSGQTYEPSLIEGYQFLAVAGQNGSVMELDGPFTIQSISDMEGNDIETAETEQVVYHTSNASGNYSALQEQIRALNQKIEERKAKATSGGSGGDSSGGNPFEALAQLLGISAGATVVVVVAGGLLVVRIYRP